MFWLKLCPKCQGDLHDGVDGFGRYVTCLQCGRYLSRPEERALGIRTLGKTPPEQHPEVERTLPSTSRRTRPRLRDNGQKRRA
jgi:hypothetical protein